MGLITRWIFYFTSGLGTGLLVTIQTLIVATVFSVVWALVIAVMRMSSVKPLQLFGLAYIEFFRGTPFLIQILVIYFAIPKLINYYPPPFPTAVLALTLNVGGSLAETYRSGIGAVPLGQREAAASLGMSNRVIFQRVILPQAIRVIIPGVGNAITALLLTTPFVFLVGLEDMMGYAVDLLNRTGDMSVYLLVTIIYAVMALMLVGVNLQVERRVRLPVR